MRKNIILEKKMNKIHHKVTKIEIFLYFFPFILAFFENIYFHNTQKKKNVFFFLNIF
jgi:hypothetical protein